MAALDFSDLGLRATLGPMTHHGDVVSVAVRVEDAGLQAALDRLGNAARELEAAWLAVPQGARDAHGDAVLTLHARPKG